MLAPWSLPRAVRGIEARQRKRGLGPRASASHRPPVRDVGTDLGQGRMVRRECRRVGCMGGAEVRAVALAPGMLGACLLERGVPVDWACKIAGAAWCGLAGTRCMRVVGAKFGIS